MASVMGEINFTTSFLGRNRPISHVHFGGGTPNVLTNKDIDGISSFLRATYNFSADHEIAMELDPRVITLEQVKTLAANGVTRVSLGIQDFHNDVQQAIHRIQSYDLVKRACDWLHDAGIPHINFDLVYGLPLQTPASVAETALLVRDLSPSRIALFSYAHVPQMKKHQAALESYGLPDIIERLAMEDGARKIFIDAGYVEIGMDHFARPNDAMAHAYRTGKLRRNFQGYTTDTATTMLGIGASSISQTPYGYFQNAHDESDYKNLINSGTSAIKRGHLLTADDRLRGDIIEQLMCYQACDIEAVCKKHHVNAASFSPEILALQPYIESGLIARDGYKICLTSPHRMAVRVICQIFDSYTPHIPIAQSRIA